MKQIAVVTGASSGMGREFVLQIAEKYPKLDEIWAIARRGERLEALSKDAGRPVRALPMDVTDRESVRRFAALLAAERPRVRLLVLSAGCGRMGSFLESAAEDSVQMVDLNCTALTAMTRAALPYLCAKSRLIFLASSAAFAPQPGFAVYAATKAYVLSLARALRQELRGRGIRVTAVCPGPVDTEFFLHAGDTAKMSAVKRLSMAAPGPVVRKALRDAAAGRAVSVYGVWMKASRAAAKALPHGALVPLMDRLLCAGRTAKEPRAAAKGERS